MAYTKADANSKLKGDFGRINKDVNVLLKDLANIDNDTNKGVADMAVAYVSEARINDSEHASAYASSGMSREDFIRSLSDEQQLSLSTKEVEWAKTMGDGSDAYGKIKKAIKTRDMRKEDYKNKAKFVVSEYQRVINENDAELKKIDVEITSKKEEVKKIGESIAKIQEQPDDETITNASGATITKHNDKDITELQARESTLLSEILLMESDYKEVMKEQNSFIDKFNKQKEKIKKAFTDKRIALDLGDEQNANAEENNTQASMDGGNNNGNRRGYDYNLAPRAIAQDILNELRKASRADRDNLIKKYGFTQVLYAAEELGPLEKIELRRMLKRSLSKNSIDFDCIGGGIISKSKLENIRKLNKDDLEEIRDAIDKFNNNYSGLDGDAQYELRKELDKLSCAFIIGQTRWFEGFRQRFSIGKAGERADLANDLKDYGNKNYAVGINAYKEESNFRKDLGKKAKSSIGPKSKLDPYQNPLLSQEQAVEGMIVEDGR